MTTFLSKNQRRRPIHSGQILQRLIGLRAVHNFGPQVNGIEVGGKFEYLEFGYL